MPHHDRHPRCYFFLSYARGDDSDSIQRFYRDVCNDVRDHAGLPRGTEVGFLDTHSMDLGVAWSTRLMRDLARCDTFIALVSPRYLRSEMCGREWTVFANRLAMHTAPSGEAPAALMPLLWLPPPVLPAVIRDRQYENDLLPPAYGDKGLRQMIRLDRYRNEYVEFVDSLARQIVRTAEQCHVPPTTSPLDFHQVPSALHRPAPTPTPSSRGEPDRGPASTGVPQQTGPPTVDPADGDHGHGVRFVIVAPSAADVRSTALAPIGRDVRFYGPNPIDWSPYLPDLGTSLATFAQQIAEQQQFSSLVSDVAGMHNALAEARAANQLVILLIDLWVAYLDEPRRILEQYDRPDADADAGQPLTAVMVPVSATDPQTQARHDDLSRSLKNLLKNRLHGLDGVMSRTSILSHRAFDADLQVVLERIRNEAFRTRTPYHRPAGRSGDRPILRGP